MRALILALLLPLSLHGRDRWHEPPIALEAGASIADTIPAGVSYAAANARLEPRSVNGGGIWTLSWGSDSAMAMAEVVLPDARADVGGYAQPARIALVAGASRQEAQLPSEPGPFSLRLVYDGYGARLLGGYGHAEPIFDAVPYSADSPCAVAVEASQPMRCWRFGAEWIGGDVPAFIDLAEARADIDGASSDPLAGEWEYLDRDISAASATLGGKYTVAIVPGPGGAYSIVYLSGGEAGQWRPGQVKGLLRPSGFEGNYDLEWIDARGVRLADDNDAQLDSALGVLTLRFPVYRSQIRLRCKK